MALIKWNEISKKKIFSLWKWWETLWRIFTSAEFKIFDIGKMLHKSDFILFLMNNFTVHTTAKTHWIYFFSDLRVLQQWKIILFFVWLIMTKAIVHKIKNRLLSSIICWQIRFFSFTQNPDKWNTYNNEISSSKKTKKKV
jgi:hypothetical protein